VLLDEVVGHMREKLVIPDPGQVPLVDRLRTDVKAGIDYHPYLPREDGRLPMSDFGGVHRFNVTGLYHDMWGFPSDNPEIVHGLLRHLVDKIENNANKMARYNNYFLHDAEIVLISYGSSARSALHVVKYLRKRGQRIGLLELQTLWPFPRDIVRESTIKARFIGVVEMNMGQLTQSVKLAVDRPDQVFLINRIDGELITDEDIKRTLRIIMGRGM
jgi:2-oxoglutarate ferredoxin oxidoreductase subunit alpha